MILIMLSKISSDILLEDELGAKRTFEVRILDLKSGKQKSFSLLLKTDSKGKEKPTIEELKDFFMDAVRNGRK